MLAFQRTECLNVSGMLKARQKHGSFMFGLFSHLKYLGLCTELVFFCLIINYVTRHDPVNFHVVVLKGVFLSLFTFLKTEETTTRNQIKNDMLCLQKDY